MVIVELLFILIAIGLFASAKSYQPVMLGGIGLLVIAWLVRLGFQWRALRPTKLDWPLVLFIISGMISLWVSYDVWTSLAKFYLILGGISLYYILSQASLQARLVVASGLVLFAVVLTLYFVTQQNELAANNSDKLPVLGAIGVLLRRLSPQLNLYQPHPNVVAGVLEVALLTGVGLLAIVRRASLDSPPGFNEPGYDPIVVTLIIALAVIIFGLLMTGARGAWLAVGLAWLGWMLVEMQRASRLRTLDTLALVTIVGSLLLLLLLGFKGSADLPLAERLASRVEIYRGSGQLVRDYIITGAGLGTFPLLYSAYVLGIDVVEQNHTHNFYLSVWLEQGLLGITALLWLGFAFIRAYRRWRKNEAAGAGDTQHLLATASFWAMMVIFFHGLVDSTPYNSRFLPLLFVPLGLSGFLLQPVAVEAKRRTRRIKPTLNDGLAVGGIVVLTLLLLIGTPALSSWYANLGAVTQAKIELSDYHIPDRIPSQVRASADLSRPIMLFERALELGPENVTATERLELISQATGR